MNNTQNKFISQDNKRILWEIMIENNLFNGIPDKYSTNVKGDFENILQQMSGNIPPNSTILEINKNVIRQMIEEIKKYSSLAHQGQQQQLRQQQQGIPITSADAQTRKQAQFQIGLQTKQEEFNRLIQPVKPVTIDFTDKIDDEPIGSDMEIRLAQTIAWREEQLSQVLDKQDSSKASEWINNGKKVINSVSNSVSNTIQHIKIGGETKLDDNNIINVKKVSFNDVIGTNAIGTNVIGTNVIGTNVIGTNAIGNDSENITFNFMDKLKKTTKNQQVEVNVINPQVEVKNQPVNVNNPQVNVNNQQVNVNNQQVDKELSLIKQDIALLLEQNKIILEKQDKIIDILTRIDFQF